jgi:GNAT superfamily N-acetyltransferase
MNSPSLRVKRDPDGEGGWIEAHEGDTVQGRLYFALFIDGSIGVEIVEVDPDCQRRGVATAMLVHLIELNPNTATYRAAIVSEASQRLFDSMAAKRPDITFDTD